MKLAERDLFVWDGCCLLPADVWTFSRLSSHQFEPLIFVLLLVEHVFIGDPPHISSCQTL